MNGLGKLIATAEAKAHAHQPHAAGAEARGAGKGGVFQGILARLGHAAAVSPQVPAADAGPEDAGAMRAAGEESVAVDDGDAGAARQADERPRRKMPQHPGEAATDSQTGGPMHGVGAGVIAAPAVGEETEVAGAWIAPPSRDERDVTGSERERTKPVEMPRNAEKHAETPRREARPAVAPRHEAVNSIFGGSAAPTAAAPMPGGESMDAPAPRRGDAARVGEARGSRELPPEKGAPLVRVKSPTLDDARYLPSARNVADDRADVPVMRADAQRIAPDEPRLVPTATGALASKAAPDEQRAAGDSDRPVALRVVGAPPAWRGPDLPAMEALSPAPLQDTATPPAETRFPNAAPPPAPTLSAPTLPPPTLIVRAEIVAAETHLAPAAPRLAPAMAAPHAEKSVLLGRPVFSRETLSDGAVDDAGQPQAFAFSDAARLPQPDPDALPPPEFDLDGAPVSERGGREPSIGPVTAASSGNAQAVTPTASAGLPAPALRAVTSAVIAAAGSSATLSAAAVAAPTAVGGPARVMTLRVEVPDHGGVDVRMTVRGRAMHVDLRADREETAKRLRHDRDALTRALADGGYDTDIRAIDFRPPDALVPQRQAAAGGDGGAPGQGPASGQAGGDQRPSETRGEQRRGGDERAAEQPRDKTHDQTNPDDSRTRGLYV